MSLVNSNNLFFPALIDEIFKPDWFGGLESSSSSHLPPVNIKEGDVAFELEFLVPGRGKEDFKIDIDNNILAVVGELRADTVKKDDNYSQREFSLKTFKRSFTLPNTIDSEKIEAKYENGILRLVLPKKIEAMPKPKRQIELS